MRVCELQHVCLLRCNTSGVTESSRDRFLDTTGYTKETKILKTIPKDVYSPYPYFSCGLDYISNVITGWNTCL